jgi:hypothetical protein
MVAFSACSHRQYASRTTLFHPTQKRVLVEKSSAPKTQAIEVSSREGASILGVEEELKSFKVIPIIRNKIDSLRLTTDVLTPLSKRELSKQVVREIFEGQMKKQTRHAQKINTLKRDISAKLQPKSPKDMPVILIVLLFLIYMGLVVWLLWALNHYVFHLTFKEFMLAILAMIVALFVIYAADSLFKGRDIF